MPIPYVDTETCAKCGGDCCKRMPGFAVPHDIARNFPSGDMRDSIAAAVMSGQWVINGCLNDDLVEVHFMRPRQTNDALDSILHDIHRGECIFLTPDGCGLSDLLRPWNCRIVKPNRDKPGHCSMPFLDYRWPRLATRAWAPYQSELIDTLRDIEWRGENGH